MALTYRVCMVYTVCFLYKGILYLAKECQLNTDYTSVVGVEHYNFNSGHRESTQLLIVDCMFRPL